MKLVKKEFTANYRKKWNIIMDDFVQLADDNGNLLSDNVYRRSGFFNELNLQKRYFELIKYVEGYYPDSITKEKKRKPHLAGLHCILNMNGVEKVVCDSFEYPYIIKDSVIYSINGNYYNIETGEFYGKAATVIDSENFIIIENRWNAKDDFTLGVFIIDKKTGTKKLFDNIS